MKIYKNTHKGAPLQDAIDEYASTYEARNAAARVDLLRRVKVHMAIKIRVEDKEVGVEIAQGVTVKVVKGMITEVRAKGEPAAANDAKS